ncbi:MAG TPA: DsbA family oxidoreductase [Pyrinomonadaceae bacterium]|nr:DsbA family oxidoreductase [Pyrinomonadaceae bacterium]
MTLKIDVYSDVICPWCFVGKHRLEKALAAVKDRFEARVTWHPFELNPEMPKEGLNRKEYRSAKFGSWEKSLALDEQVKKAGESEGIHFRHDLMERTPNTFDAHKLILLAGREGVQDKVTDAVFNGYFVEGKDVGNRDTLIKIAVNAGMNAEQVKNFLESEESTNAVNEAKEKGRELRISGVPNFIINNQVSFSGAQSVETFIAAFEQAINSAMA